MPWAERDRMSLRQELVHLVATQRVSMTELCQRFQISRKTGYKWVKRFRTEGEAMRGWPIGRDDRIRCIITCQGPLDSIFWRNGSNIRRGARGNCGSGLRHKGCRRCPPVVRLRPC